MAQVRAALLLRLKSSTALSVACAYLGELHFAAPAPRRGRKRKVRACVRSCGCACVRAFSLVVSCSDTACCWQ